MMGNALALLGLLAIAIPIAIHLLGRHQSRIERFPTLRFIGTSRLNPTKRRRITDLPLLLVRIAIIASAAIALTQPVFRSSPGNGSAGISRVVIVDTSASVSRTTLQDSLVAGAVASIVLTDDPESAIDGSVAWLATRPGLREIAIVSDFQRSTIDSAALARVPLGIGLSFSVVPSAPRVIPSEARDLHVGQVQIPRSTRDDIGTLAGSADLPGADAAWRAIGRTRPTDSTGRIAIIYRNHPAAPALAASSVPVDSMWMARIVAAIARDRTLLATAPDLAGIRFAREGNRLLIFMRDDAGSLTSAALNAAVVRATTPTVPSAERDQTTWTRADLARWELKPVATTAAPIDASDARWVWAVCLALIGLETWMRSRKRAAAVVELSPREERAA